MKLVEGFPATSNDAYPLNVTRILEHAARTFGRQEIASRKLDGSLFRYTYADALSRVRRLASGLTGLGIEPGDRVGVLAWNTHENYEIYFGVPGTGAVMLLLNLRLAPADIAHVVNHAQAKAIIVDETLLPIAHAIAGDCPTVKEWIVVASKSRAPETHLSPVHDYEALLDRGDPDFAFREMTETSAYAACYTTGTTGQSKGVYYSHRAVYLHTLSIALSAELTIRDTFFQLVPMFHALGWGTPQAATLVGARILFPGMYTLDNLDPLAKLLVDEGVTVADGAPAIFMPLLEYVRKLGRPLDLKGARFLSGATEPPVAMMKGWYDLTGAEIVHAYGATETTPLVTLNRFKPWLDDLDEDARWDLKRKQGLVVVGLDVKVVDAEGNALPADGKSAGEVLIRGPWVTRAYHDAPGTEGQFTEDGWWRSGDAGTLDAEGYLKLTDRMKDLIKSGGEWISSVDMENEIVGHPAVLEAAVVGLAHPRWQERPLALVVLRPEHVGKVTDEDIRTHLAAKFAKWQLPDEVRFVDALPKTSVGKISKRTIRETWADLYSHEE